MPTPGLSLVGFIDDQQQAINHLLNACIPATPDPIILAAEWTAAKAKLGTPFANSGNPNIQPIPASHHAYMNQVLAFPVFSAAWPTATIELVEIDAILAYQITIDNDRSAYHGNTLSNPPTLDELMTMCLPLTPPSENFKVFPGQNSMVLKAKCLNIRQLQGLWNQTFMGIQFGVSLPFAHVVRYGGRCYLFNGYHRALCVRMAGATHIPCVVRDVADHKEVGLNPPDFFSPALLTSNNPPTLGHFTQGRAHTVSLRQHSRIIHVSWAEHAIPDE
ncbi:MAG: hypothetical protein ABSC72_08520 [Methylovirgula sp.]|jgi:hypothetical protein